MIWFWDISCEEELVAATSKMCTNLVDVQSLYDKDKDLKQDDVRKLQVWLEKQPHLPQITGE